jgi:hypothetical protein
MQANLYFYFSVPRSEVDWLNSHPFSWLENAICQIPRQGIARASRLSIDGAVHAQASPSLSNDTASWRGGRGASVSDLRLPIPVPIFFGCAAPRWQIG